MQKCTPKIYFIPLKVWSVFDFILALLEIMQYNLFSVKSYSRKFSWKLNVIVLTCQCLHEKHKYIGYHRACRQVEPIIFSITFRWLVFAKPCSNLCIPKRFVRDIYVRAWSSSSRLHSAIEFEKIQRNFFREIDLFL